ncbi:MAG: valine--tRNA ligase, partial [Opitutaceae bacterium]|nr:valine--tRNA ligase [Opitutaceae bacterium]
NTLQDALVRRARLEGKSARWIPGTDHAGIATQTMVEKHLKKTEGKSRRDIGRDAFLRRVWEWRREKGGVILRQLRELGCSCDWEHTHFTMDPAYSRAVLTAFVKLFDQGRVYRGKRMVNWCPATLTALSDEEVEMRPAKSLLYKVRYDPADAGAAPVLIETTRPETIPADAAIAVHPDDPRYQNLIGKHVWRPLGPRVPIPVIADTAVDPSFGTGALKVTPAHDKVDFDIGRRHQLPVTDILNPDGTLNALAGPGLAGLDRFKARDQSAQLLRASGNLVAETPYENNVGFSQRAGVPIEPRLMQQWWLRYPRVEEAKQVVRDGLLRFHPERWSKVYLNWLDNIQDWCVSRQLWWGHRIPVWYKKGLDRENLSETDLRDPAKVHVSVNGPADPENWEQEDDVLDTWASSWLWPLATQGWPDPDAMNAAQFDKYYPTSTLATGADIIFFWVARMVMAGLEFSPGKTSADSPSPLASRIPFRDVYFNGIVRDKQGRKMSKTLGNSPDPLDLIAKYGADGLRFGLLQIAPLGQDVKFDEDRVAAGKNFCNKLWNASRFRQMSGPMSDNTTLDGILSRINPAQLDDDDHALLNALLDTSRILENAFASFEFATATQQLYSFFWTDFCDWYVEVAKARLQDPASQTHVLAIQDLVLRQFLLLLEPFAPFITEELWHLLGYAPETDALLQQTRLPSAAQLQQQLAALGIFPDPDATHRVNALKKTVTLARQLKADHAAAQKRDVTLSVIATDPDWQILRAATPKIIKLVGAAALNRVPDKLPQPAVLTPLGTLFLDTGVKADPAAERARLQKELAQVEKHIAATEARLANKAFTDKAPPAVIAGAKVQLSAQQTRRAELQRLLEAL